MAATVQFEIISTSVNRVKFLWKYSLLERFLARERTQPVPSHEKCVFFDVREHIFDVGLLRRNTVESLRRYTISFVIVCFLNRQILEQKKQLFTAM